MSKKRTWIHLWGDTYIPKTNLLIVIGLLTAIFFISIFEAQQDLTPALIFLVIMIVLFIIVARKEGVER